MLSVLLSIRPKWCELIASGKKTIEVRKTRPKIETPFKCYIYETKARSDMPTFVDEDGHVLYTGRGQVIGEFVCDYINTYLADDFVGAEDFDGTIITEPEEGEFAYWVPEQEETCLTCNELNAYGKGKTLYGWHISNLKIYDKPRELSEFGRGCDAEKIGEIHCRDCKKLVSFDDICEVMCKPLNSPPQSWGYVEDRI